MNIYLQNGFENRKEYLNSLAEDFGIPVKQVYLLANLLGENEDFDGLISSLEDYADEFGE
jgi:hypothetical protein